MTVKQRDMPPMVRGLYIPDSNNETPPGSLSQATNIQLTDNGGIRQRYGTSQPAGVDFATHGYSFTHSEQLVIVQTDGTGSILTGDTTSLTEDATFTGGPGTATAHAQMQRSETDFDSNTYLARPGAIMMRYNGATFTTVASSPQGRYLATGLKSERMWAAGFDDGAYGPSASDAGPSRVFWTDPLSPEVWPIANYQDFGPGDGESITGLASFSGQIFVFKPSRFWVIYSITVSGGATTLNYREVTGAGLIQPGALCPTDRGIFFYGKEGIYRTDGGPAEEVSAPINGIFSGNLPSWTVYDRLLPPQTKSVLTMAASNDTLYIAAGDQGTNDCSSCVLAYHFHNGTWTYFTLEVASLFALEWPTISYPLIVGVTETATDFVPFAMHPFLREDAGEWMPVTAQLHWFQDETEAGSVAMDTMAVQRLDAFGLGIMQVGLAVDFQASPSGWKELPFTDVSIADVWGDGTDPLDVWGDGSSPTDVWGGSISAATDLLRLQPPDHKYVAAIPGRGRYLSPVFNKMPTSTYFYLERPRMTLFGRGK